MTGIRFVHDWDAARNDRETLEQYAEGLIDAETAEQQIEINNRLLAGSVSLQMLEYEVNGLGYRSEKNCDEMSINISESKETPENVSEMNCMSGGEV